MGSSIKVSARAVERLIMYTGYLSAFMKQGKQHKTHTEEILQRGQISSQRPSCKVALPRFAPKCTGGTSPSPESTQKWAWLCMHGAGPEGFAEP